MKYSYSSSTLLPHSFDGAKRHCETRTELCTDCSRVFCCICFSQNNTQDVDEAIYLKKKKESISALLAIGLLIKAINWMDTTLQFMIKHWLNKNNHKYKPQGRSLNQHVTSVTGSPTLDCRKSTVEQNSKTSLLLRPFLATHWDMTQQQKPWIRWV